MDFAVFLYSVRPAYQHQWFGPSMVTAFSAFSFMTTMLIRRLIGLTASSLSNNTADDKPITCQNLVGIHTANNQLPARSIRAIRR
jgi:hypothetical protein